MHVINYDMPNSDYGGINEYVHRIGRTARIGNVGMATSFYNDKNEDIAEPLTKLLLETTQTVPDFLEGFKPEDEYNLVFDDDTDNEGEDGGESAGGWGGGAVVASKANGDAAAGGWGAGAANDTSDGWS